MSRQAFLNFLKIVLPLTALALLSTLFLFSRDVDPLSQLPVARTGLEERARDQQVTAPYFSGKTRRGDVVTVSARAARPEGETGGRIFAETVSARIDTIGGARVSMTAREGVFDQSEQQLTMTGEVEIRTSIGYEIFTPLVRSELGTLHITGGPVEAMGPPGTFTASAMLITGEADGAAHMVFTGGVKLVYTPQVEEK